MTKYKAKKTTYSGVIFDSRKEAEYCYKLDLAKKAFYPKDKVISYDMQVPFEVKVNGAKICTYKLDFKVTYADNTIKFIDVKGMKTPVYRLKKKLVEAIYGITITEV
jgi:protein associated with RNAse G/E